MAAVDSSDSAKFPSMSDGQSDAKDVEAVDLPSLFDEANKQVENGEYEAAVNSCTKYLENSTKDAQNAATEQTAKAYLLYGRALLRLSQLSDDVFGEGISNYQEQANDAMNQGESVAEDQNVKNSAESESKEAESGEISADGQAQLVDALTKMCEKAITYKEQLEQQAERDAQAVGDRELAWESLDTARQLLVEMEGTKEQMQLLGDAHSFLGEVLMEDERFSDAYAEFEKAIEVYDACGCSPRTIASIHSLWAVCAAYNKDNDSCVLQYRKSAELLLKQIALNSNCAMEEGGPKSEQISILDRKTEILSHAKTKAADLDASAQAKANILVELFEETMERLTGAEAVPQLGSDDVLMAENDTNGVTTIGFGGPTPALTGPVNDLGVVRKKKRTANDADLNGELPEAKKQRVD